MITPEKYIEQLLTNNGRGLPPGEAAIFDKLREVDRKVTALERQLVQLDQEKARTQQLHQLTLGQGQAYATLLIEAEAERMKNRVLNGEAPAPGSPVQVPAAPPSAVTNSASSPSAHQ